MAASSSSSVASIPVTSKPSLSQKSLISLNVAAQAPLKLTSTNYFSWKAQFDALLLGYDLYGYVDGNLSCPSILTIFENSTKSVPNPDDVFWVRQDKLILSAILASLSKDIAPLVSGATTSLKA